ncbi:MAG: hypothetical protein HY900_25725 [Deltaproteobacteria bacterium]|nr:hypothetical protein [Deltaproteobacteria bacterium]
MEDLLRAIAQNDVPGAIGAFDAAMARGEDPWRVHLDLYPLAQRVLNPPFINPHLPKMHAICREFLPYLEAEDLPALVRVEVGEYARRPLLPETPRADPPRGAVTFADIEAAVSQGDRAELAARMAAFDARQGSHELVRRLALLGSGYLDSTLGHAISCTVFILQEMLARSDHDRWPVFAGLAEYFCRGHFEHTPTWRTREKHWTAEDLNREALRAVSAGGVVNLHHTITLYSVDRTRAWLSDEELAHMQDACASFMGEKQASPVAFETTETTSPSDYKAFLEVFLGLNAPATVASLGGLLGSREERRRLGRYLSKAVCDAYQGEYDPHFLTGLGAALWVIERFWDQPPIAYNGLLQYVTYFYRGLQRTKSGASFNRPASR